MKSFSSAPSSPQQTRDLDLSRPCTKPLVILSPLVNKTPSSLNSSSGGGILTLLWLRTITWHLEGVILMLHGWPRTTPVTVEDCGLMKPAEPSHLQQHNTKATKPKALGCVKIFCPWRRCTEFETGQIWPNPTLTGSKSDLLPAMWTKSVVKAFSMTSPPTPEFLASSAKSIPHCWCPPTILGLAVVDTVDCACVVTHAKTCCVAVKGQRPGREEDRPNSLWCNAWTAFYIVKSVGFKIKSIGKKWYCSFGVTYNLYTSRFINRKSTVTIS